MPNILLTNYCNRNCPYCFAKDRVYLDTDTPQWEMPEEEFRIILGYLKPGIDHVSLLGGEPTLHSRFSEIVALAVHAGYFVKIFTNGVSRVLRKGLSGMKTDSLAIILNLNTPDTYSEKERTEIETNCRAFGPALQLSFNIYTPDFSWDFLRHIILKCGIKPTIRLGITQPIQGASNIYLNEKDMPETYGRIVTMVEYLAKSGINVGFDCGFRLCGFTKSERGILAECGVEFLFACRPVLDIGPDLMVWRCFPFSTDRCVKLTDFKTFDEIVTYFNRRWERVQRLGNTDQCQTCMNLKSATCHGGCLSRTLILNPKQEKNDYTLIE